MSRRYNVRGASAFRVPNRCVKCEHCGAHYNVATDFEAHYEGACVRTQKERANG